MILWHTAPRSARRHIARWGLVPGHTSGGNYEGLRGQPRGVYGFLRRYRAASWSYGSALDLWRIDATGLPTIRDPILRNARVVLETVPPNRLTLEPYPYERRP